MKAFRRLRPVIVEWVDSCSRSSQHWTDEKDAEKWCRQGFCHVRTIGYVFHETKKKIVLIQGKTSSGSVDGLFEIPKGCIRRIRELGPKK